MVLDSVLGYGTKLMSKTGRLLCVLLVRVIVVPSDPEWRSSHLLPTKTLKDRARRRGGPCLVG